MVRLLADLGAVAPQPAASAQAHWLRAVASYKTCVLHSRAAAKMQPLSSTVRHASRASPICCSAAYAILDLFKGEHCASQGVCLHTIRRTDGLALAVLSFRTAASRQWHRCSALPFVRGVLALRLCLWRGALTRMAR